MSDDPFQRLQGESAAAYAGRMRNLIGDIVGIVHVEAGLLIDIDEVLADLDWIIAQPHDEERKRVFERQRRINRVVGHMTSASRLRRILIYAEEMAQ